MNNSASLKSVMIFDDDADFRNLLLTILSKKFTEVNLIEYDPVAQGVPGDNFDWSKVDVLLLDYHLSIPRTTGLDILQTNRKNKLFPATIMLTGAGNEEIAVRAVKAGVYDYLRKETLDKERLYSTILDAFEKHKEESAKLNELTSQSHAFNKALFYQELEQLDKSKSNRVLILIELDDRERLEKRLGIIFRDNIIRHIAKQSFEVFKQGDANPSITRFGDTSVAMLIDEPKSRSVVEFNLEGLCMHLEKHPYMYDGKIFPATVSIGALCLSDKMTFAEDYIEHAINAARKASLENGNSFYLYNESDWGLLDRQTVTRQPLQKDAEPAQNSMSVAREETRPVSVIPVPPEPRAESMPVTQSGDNIARTPPDEDSSSKLKKTASTPSETTPAQGPKKPDAKELNEIMQKVKAAFEEKRAVQTFQQVISLTHEESDLEMYLVAVQLINTDGSVISAEDLNKVSVVPAFRKFIDRWMLQEIIGRVVNRAHEKYDFFIKISADSIADATFFNWLRKLLKGLDKNNPGERIIFKISAQEIVNIQKQAGALTAFFKKTHGFRFVLTDFTADQGILDLSKSLQVNFISAGFGTITILNTLFPEQPSDNSKSSLLQLLRKEGIHVIADDVEDATKLTDTIALGVDYATGSFIGEPVNRLDDVTNVETFEII